MRPYDNRLDPQRKEIRVLILQPLQAGPSIQCSTETVSLLDNPDYEALSYVWGDASIRENIIFDGVPFPVTKNLAIALHHLRLPDQLRRLWVDALCINQNDVIERNQQVTMMDEVYVNAKPVLIFPGEASDDSDENLALINALSDVEVMSGEDSRKLFSFYIGLVEREWFTRLWTIQELVLADQDPLIGCGFTWTTWSSLLHVWQKVALREMAEMNMVIHTEKESPGSDQDFRTGVRPAGIKIDLLNNLRTAVGENHGETLRDLLLNTVSARATEPKDRVYGLLGMLDKEDRKFFKVDYGLPLGTVYAQAMAHIFQKGVGPFLLSGMELAGSSPEDLLFPSWVPMLGNKSLLSPTRYHPAGVGVSGPGSGAVNGVVDEDLKILRVRGMHIDTVLANQNPPNSKNLRFQL